MMGRAFKEFVLFEPADTEVFLVRELGEEREFTNHGVCLVKDNRIIDNGNFEKGA